MARAFLSILKKVPGLKYMIPRQYESFDHVTRCHKTIDTQKGKSRKFGTKLTSKDSKQDISYRAFFTYYLHRGWTAGFPAASSAESARWTFHKDNLVY